MQSEPRRATLHGRLILWQGARSRDCHRPEGPLMSKRAAACAVVYDNIPHNYPAKVSAMSTLESIQRLPRIGSGTVIVVVVAVVVLVLLVAGDAVGLDRVWRTFAAPSIQPPFRDMHAVTDHAGCFVKGYNPYFSNLCDPLRAPFNSPPLWLWLGYLGINSGDTLWLSVLVAMAALGVVGTLMRGRPIGA